MPENMNREYPPEAYAPDGKLWWDRKSGAGPKGATGNKPRAASWLKFNVAVGDRFSMDEIRQALGVRDEHFQRRIRELRTWGWVIDGMKDMPGLNAEYLMRQHGWWPGSLDSKPDDTSSIDPHTRRKVLERDGSRCTICGVGAAENYPEPPRNPARMTIGHVIPAQQGGSNKIDNLRCECARCNETVRAESGSGESFDDLLASARRLPAADKKTLLRWLRQNSRERSDLDAVYDRIRLAAPGVRDQLTHWLGERISL